MKTIIFINKPTSMTMAARERKYQREKDLDELIVRDIDALNRFRISVLVGEI